MMKSLRLIVPALSVALLAACSVPVSQDSVDLGLNLESQRIVVRRPSAPLNSIGPAQVVASSFTGQINVTTSKIEDRLTLTELEIPVELFADVEITPADALDGVAEVILGNFEVSFSVSDDTNSVDIGSLDMPVTVSLDLVAGTADWELDAGADIFTLVVLSGAMDQVNDIITGSPSDEFTFTAQISFEANLPAELESISFRLRDGDATVKGRAKIL